MGGVGHAGALAWLSDGPGERAARAGPHSENQALRLPCLPCLSRALFPGLEAVQNLPVSPGCGLCPGLSLGDPPIYFSLICKMTLAQDNSENRTEGDKLTLVGTRCGLNWVWPEAGPAHLGLEAM